MKLMKRALALLLCFLMLTNGPISAFATEGNSENDVVVETTTTTETEEVCEECGGSDAHTETCSFNIVAPLTTETPDETTEPTTTPAETTEPATTPTLATGPAISTDPVGCTECGATEGHTTECSQSEVPMSKCEHCGIELTEGAVHLDTCLTLCTCKPVEGVHQEGCKFYDASVETCEHCGIELAEGAVHLDTCLTLCTCEPVEGVHQDGCKFYVAATEEITENTGPQVGDKIWIKSGSIVYKNHNDVNKNFYTLKGNYQVEVKKILINDDGVAEWYEFRFADLGIGEIALSMGGYKYVHIDNTSVEEPEPSEPVDENACNCGENSPENIADHADSCPRKQYIKTLFESKTAEEIYAQWETYDEATQSDLLNMLQQWDNTKYEELKKLIEEGFNNEQETVVGDTDIVVAGIPDDVSLAVSSVSENDYHSALKQYVGKDSELLFVYDITLTNPDGSEWQPANGQSATITLDFNGMGFADGNVLSVLHEHGGELKALGDYAIEEGKLTFTTNGFSKFYFYITYTYGEQSFTMSGGGAVTLSEILSGLHISYSISDVASVSFSNPDVLKITRVGSDWKLESLAPFGSEEILTITFNNGEVIEIIVKDPVIYNYAVGSHITNVSKKATANRTMKTVNNGDGTIAGKTYLANTAVITNAELIEAAGSASSVNIIVYAVPGMAIGFEAGTTWPSDTSRPSSNGSEIWFWSWANSADSDTYINYAIVKDGTAGKQTTFPITAVSGNTNVTVNVTICSVTNSSPTLLQGNLPSGYSLKNVPVTLYNYDGKAFNSNYENGGSNYFAFHGVSEGVNAREGLSNYGWMTASGKSANAGGGVAMMGIVKENLVNGLPVMSQGQNVDLFSTEHVNGKTVYEDVQFQFVYNDSTGYYTYNAALNHAQYNSSSNTIELYQQSLGPSDTPNGDAHGNAGFYPFEDIHQAYTNTGYTAISQTEWVNKIENSFYELTPAQYATDIVTTASTNPASTVGLNYGLQMASDFYMPKGKQLNGQDMIYKFTGDDDLWVFIDGKLVLDIGGGHTAVSGSFNLTTGEVYIEKYTKLNAANGGSYANLSEGKDLRYTDEFLTGLKDDQMHTIQIFYLERHAGVSNCYMHFNLPLAPSNAVNVSKNLVNQNGQDLSVTPDVEYTFTLYTAADTDDNCDATEFNVYANKAYTLTGSGAPTETQYTNSNGQFTLKDGWIASFQGISRFHNVYVVESAPSDGYIYTKSTISVNKAAATDYTFGNRSDTKVMQLNSSINYDFVNFMKTQPLTIEKQVVNGTQGLIDSDQKFTFTLDFIKPIIETGVGAISATNQSDASVSLTDGGEFQLGHGDTITIAKVPVNMTFTLKEANPDAENGSFDAPKFESTICTTTETPNAFDMNYTWTMGDNGENKIVVTNQQRFNLTIEKTGIQNVDHDNDEQQSTIYTIVGKIGNTVLVEMDVAICGNDSVTICKLPVGSYTVVENTDWAWRYDPEDGATRNVIIPQDAKAEVTYNNNRTNQYWLSGDSYCENWWGGSEGIQLVKRNEKNIIIND